MMITPELNNQLIEELIREYFSFNKYFGALDSMMEESSLITEVPALTRNSMVKTAQINPTS